MKYPCILVPVVLMSFQAVHAADPHTLFNAKRQNKPDCQNSHTIFANNITGWTVEATSKDAFEVTPEGLKLNLLPPRSYQRMIHEATQLPYNSAIGHGPTFNSSTYMQYGRFSAKVKSAKVGGAITAVILIADGGDEIDYEMLGGSPNTVETNYFWGKHPLYTVNGGSHAVPGGAMFEEFHTYTIDWKPDRITWEIDGTVIRTKERSETCKGDVCKFPSNPARVQIGLWDGSFEFGTAEWSHGPINWERQEGVSAYLQEVVIECDPEYNNIVD